MDENFINIYIMKLNEKISELLRSEIILKTQLDIAQQLINSISEESKELKNQAEEHINKSTETNDFLDKKPTKKT